MRRGGGAGLARQARHLHWIAASLLLLIAGWTSAATAEEEVPVATAIRIAPEAERTRFIADVTRPVSFSVHVLPDPYRIIVDLPEIAFRLPSDSGGSGAGLLTGYRYGNFAKGRSRIVMDAAEPVLIDKSFIIQAANGEPARLVIDLVRTERETFMGLYRAEQLALDGAAKPGEDVPKELPPISFGPPIAPLPPSEPPRAAEGPVKQQPSNRIAALPDGRLVPMPRPRPGPRGGDSKLGEPGPPSSPPLRPTIVIDPGHGGIDPGAISRKGTSEKNVVLAFAKALQEELGRSGRYRVLMTRSDDTFLSLSDRVRVARSNNADLFVVIHADSLSGANARGATVYTVSEKASDVEAEALAQKENRADIIAGVDLAVENEEITGILIDLAQRETKNYSVSFAKTLVKELKPVARLNGRPVRSAGFRVLKAPDVPSVLLELGYLSNRSDESLLLSPKWRGKVAGAVSGAIGRYFATRLASGQ